MDRVLGFEPSCWGFESLQARNEIDKRDEKARREATVPGGEVPSGALSKQLFGPIAQLVEQFPLKESVQGSNPCRLTENLYSFWIKIFRRLSQNLSNLELARAKYCSTTCSMYLSAHRKCYIL